MVASPEFAVPVSSIAAVRVVGRSVMIAVEPSAGPLRPINAGVEIASTRTDSPLIPTPVDLRLAAVPTVPIETPAPDRLAVGDALIGAVGAAVGNAEKSRSVAALTLGRLSDAASCPVVRGVLRRKFGPVTPGPSGVAPAAMARLVFTRAVVSLLVVTFVSRGVLTAGLGAVTFGFAGASFAFSATAFGRGLGFSTGLDNGSGLGLLTTTVRSRGFGLSFAQRTGLRRIRGMFFGRSTTGFSFMMRGRSSKAFSKNSTWRGGGPSDLCKMDAKKAIENTATFATIATIIADFRRDATSSSGRRIR